MNAIALVLSLLAQIAHAQTGGDGTTRYSSRSTLPNAVSFASGGSTIAANGTFSISTAASAALVGVGAPNIFIGSNGNVGVHTNSPTADLLVVGPGNTGGNISVGVNNGGGSTYLSLVNTTNGGQTQLTYTHGAVSEWALGQPTGGNNLVLASSSTNVAVFNAALGFMGVGTNSPATKLHLSSGVLTLDGTTPGLSLAAGAIGALPSTAMVQLSTAVVITTDGRILINTVRSGNELFTISSGTVRIDGSGGLAVSTPGYTGSGGLLTFVASTAAWFNPGTLVAASVFPKTVALTGVIIGDVVSCGGQSSVTGTFTVADSTGTSTINIKAGCLNAGSTCAYGAVYYSCDVRRYTKP